MRLRLVQNFSAVTGACLVVRKALYLEVGGLDETLTVAFNDVDFCLKVREAGYRNVWTPYAELFHHESLSTVTKIRASGASASATSRPTAAADISCRISRCESVERHATPVASRCG